MSFVLFERRNNYYCMYISEDGQTKTASLYSLMNIEKYFSLKKNKKISYKMLKWIEDNHPDLLI